MSQKRLILLCNTEEHSELGSTRQRRYEHQIPKVRSLRPLFPVGLLLPDILEKQLPGASGTSKVFAHALLEKPMMMKELGSGIHSVRTGIPKLFLSLPSWVSPHPRFYYLPFQEMPRKIQIRLLMP